MTTSALVIGGTGPTGPLIVGGLRARGFDVTILHSGRHEVPEVADLRHLHGDAYTDEGLTAALDGGTFDVAIATYGRLRSIAQVLRGRVGRLVSVGGVPVYHGYFDPSVFRPAGLPVPTREEATMATEEEDGKSYRIARTERLLFESHPDATHFRYPYVYGPRQLVPREWCFVRRIMDRRPFVVLPDDGLTLLPFGYVDNLAHALLLSVDQPEASMGEVFNCADEETLTIRQVAELIATELGHSWELVSMPAHLAIPARPLMMGSTTTHRLVDIAKLRDRLGYRDVVPARSAVPLTARWLVEHPPERGGIEETVLEDPFDYAAEDRLVTWWRSVVEGAPDLGYEELPGFGKAYAGPGASRRRPDTRI